jgi:hypothetical protein
LTLKDKSKIETSSDNKLLLSIGPCFIMCVRPTLAVATPQIKLFPLAVATPQIKLFPLAVATPSNYSP